MIAFIKRNFKIWWTLSVNSFISSFLIFLYVYFVGAHIPFYTILFAAAMANVAVVLFFCLKRKHETIAMMRSGFILIGFSTLILLLPLPPSMLLLPYTVLSGLGFILFWVSYNIAYFSTRGIGGNYQQMTAYWAVAIIAGVIAPLMGSRIFTYLGLVPFVGTVLIMLVFIFFLVKFIPSITCSYTFPNLRDDLQGLRRLMLVDGAIHKVHSALIPLFSLLYIKREVDFGTFLSLMSLLGLIITFKIAKISDRLKKRTIFIWPLSIAAGLSVVLMYYVHSFWPFFFLALIHAALSVLNDPLRSTIILDLGKTEPLSWISREVYLNIGRGILLAVIGVLLYYGFTRAIYLVMGSLYFAFPILLYTKKIYATAR